MGDDCFAAFAVELLVDRDDPHIVQHGLGGLVQAACRRPAGSGCVTRMSTWSPGKTNPEMPEVAVTGTEMARMPGRSTAARNPRLPGETILASLIGSPGTNGLARHPAGEIIDRLGSCLDIAARDAPLRARVARQDPLASGSGRD